jgi:hypothetical protein
MKKEIAVMFFLIFLFNLVYAQTPEFFLYNESPQPGEIILGTLYGDFEKGISKQDIEIIKDKRLISMDYDLIYFQPQKKYFLYLNPNIEGEYTIKINNILFRNNETLDSINLEKNFSVYLKDYEDNLTKILSISKGFIQSSENNEKILLENKGDSELEISINNEKINLNSGETREIPISLTQTFSYLNISTYKEFLIPLIFKGEFEFQEYNEEYIDENNGNENIEEQIQERITSEDIEQSQTSCEELGGVICKYNEKCSSEEMIYANKEFCCVGGECLPIQTKGNYNFYIGLLLSIFLIIIFYFVYKKYKTSNVVDIKKELKRRINK